MIEEKEINPIYFNEELKKRDNQLLVITKEMHELKNIMIDLNKILKVQEERFDSVFETLEGTNYKLESGLKNLSIGSSLYNTVIKLGFVGTFNIGVFTFFGFKFMVPAAITSYLICNYT